MNGQADRCDRTAYVSGLQPTISDIELFEVFNRISHVEKVIVRNGVCRHALVVFKTVQGLYMVLVHFQGHFLHGRQLHIRPLRESSHANSETITNIFEKAKHQGNVQNRRPASVQERSTPASSPFIPLDEPTNNNRNLTSRCYRNSSGSYVRRRSNQHKNTLGNETYAGQEFYDIAPVPQYNMPTDNFQFEDYTEGAKRFDNLANLVRSSTPTDPFAVYQREMKLAELNAACQRSRSSSARDHSASKTAPPTWKMELQIKKNEAEALKAAEYWNQREQSVMPPCAPEVAMTPQEFLAQYAHANQVAANEQVMKKKRPNLSVINPSLFYEQYPRTSSPVTFAPAMQNNCERAASPHDPAVLAYSRLRAPQSAFAGLSPIDTNNCSFITKHLGNLNENEQINMSQSRRDMTNEELSDMIVSTGNLRINPAAGNLCNLYEHPPNDEPAPWSPVKRLRAESGSLSTAQFVSPQFSPINSKAQFNETEDDVFSSENKHPTCQTGAVLKQQPQHINSNKVLSEQKMQNYEDINNSRLPSNSHSANPNSEKKSFIFPDFPLCRHSSVPSIAHLVGDISDFGPLSPHVTAGAKFAMDNSSVLREYQSLSSSKLWDGNDSVALTKAKQERQLKTQIDNLVGI